MRKLIIPAIVLLALAALVAFWGLSRGGDDGAEAQTQVVRWVNVTLEAPVEPGVPQWFELQPGAALPIGSGLVVWPGSPSALVIAKPRDHESLNRPESRVAISAETGEIITDRIQPEDRAAFDAVLKTITVSPLDAASLPWPYTGQPPNVPRQKFLGITYIPPDPAAGISITVGVSDPGGDFIEVNNGRSLVFVDADSGIFQWEPSFLVPEDKDVLLRFLSTVEYKGNPVREFKP